MRASPVPEDGNAKNGEPNKRRTEDYHQGRINTEEFTDGHRFRPSPSPSRTQELSAETIRKAESRESDKERADQDEDFRIHHQEFGDRHHAIPLWASKRSLAACSFEHPAWPIPAVVEMFGFPRVHLVPGFDAVRGKKKTPAAWIQPGPVELQPRRWGKLGSQRARHDGTTYR